MTKRQKVDLNAQMIWLGDENSGNPLAQVLKFLKYWGVRLPYQFAYVDASCDFLTPGLKWEDFVLAHRESRHYHLRSLASHDSEIGEIFKASDSCEILKRLILKLLHSLMDTETRFVIVNTSEFALSTSARMLVLALMEETLKKSERTFFIHSLEETSWAQSCDYKIGNAFNLERYISPIAQIGEELGEKLHVVHAMSPLPSGPLTPVEKELDDEAQHLKKFG